MKANEESNGKRRQMPPLSTCEELLTFLRCCHRFASPQGILGEHYHNQLDAYQQSLPLDIYSWEQWHVPNEFMLSTESQGQMWSMQYPDVISSNVMWLPENSLPRHHFDTTLKSAASPVLLILEGPFLAPLV